MTKQTDLPKAGKAAPLVKPVQDRAGPAPGTVTTSGNPDNRIQ